MPGKTLVDLPVQYHSNRKWMKGVCNMEDLLGLAVGQLLILVGVGIVLMVLLFIFKTLLRLTKTILTLGCLGILIVLAVVFVLLQGIPI